MSATGYRVGPGDEETVGIGGLKARETMQILRERGWSAYRRKK